MSEEKICPIRSKMSVGGNYQCSCLKDKCMAWNPETKHYYLNEKEPYYIEEGYCKLIERGCG